jgi:hypothetical protein
LCSSSTINQHTQSQPLANNTHLLFHCSTHELLMLHTREMALNADLCWSSGGSWN